MDKKNDFMDSCVSEQYPVVADPAAHQTDKRNNIRIYTEIPD